MSTSISPAMLKQVSNRAKPLFLANDIEKALQRMALAIGEDLREENPVVLCVLIGGVVLTGKLLTLLDFPLQVDYIHATRYGDNTYGETLHWVAKPRISLAGRAVLIVDDILDKGTTLTEIINHCFKEGARQVKTAVLVEKQVHREKDVLQKADYTGVIAEDHYLFGYGMDYKGYLRNAPGIYAAAKEDE